MVVTLDLKDRKILYILAQEARTPPSIIARQVGLSKDAVKYRIKQLEKKEVIYNYITEVDTESLGYTGYDLFLRFNMPPENEHKISDYFNSHPNIIWSAFISGEWNYFVELQCSSNKEFDNIVSDLTARFKENLEDFDFYLVNYMYRITQIIETVYDGKEISLKDIHSPTEFPGAGKNFSLDESEKKILTVMSENARLPIHKIAQKTGLTPEVVRYRLAKLRKEGVLLRTTPVINYATLGYAEYIVLINLKKLTSEKEESIRMRIKHTTSIKYAYKALGKQSIFALMNVHDIDELEQFIKALKTDFFEIIKSINTYHITEHQRFLVFSEVLQS
jgi:DNA-binding Lrp family transcriptional regulator